MFKMIQQTPDGPAKPFQVGQLGKPVIAVFHEHGLDVPGPQFFGDPLTRLPGDVPVIRAVDQPHRAIERDFAAENKMFPAFVQKRLGYLVGLVVIVIGDFGKALGCQLLFLFGRKLAHDQVLGEVGGGGGADKARDTVRAGEGGEQYDPTAHGRPDQDLRALQQFIQDQDGVFGPASDGAVLEGARGLAMSEVIKPKKGLTAAAAEFLKRQRLATGHVGLEAGQEYHPRRLTGGTAVGDGCTIVPC